MIIRSWRQVIPVFSRSSFHNTAEYRSPSDTVSKQTNTPYDVNFSPNDVDHDQYIDINTIWGNIMKRAPVGVQALSTYRKQPSPTHFANSFFSNSFLYDPLSQKFINHLMKEGDKSKVHKLFSQALERIRTKLIQAAHISHPNSLSPPDQIDPVKYFHRALSNLMPLMEVVSMGTMGKFSVPILLRDNKRINKAINWLIEHAEQIGATNEKKDSKLAKVIELAYNKLGTAYETKIQLNKRCAAGRIHAAFRFAIRKKKPSKKRGRKR